MPSPTPKQLLVAVASSDPPRVAEALRAAIGLGLRGDEVIVALCAGGARGAAERDPAGAKALKTLEVLGRRVEDRPDLAHLVATCDAAEVWT